MNTGTPSPRPGPTAPAGPDVDELRSTFEDLLADSADRPDDRPSDEDGPDGARAAVTDHQVEALDAAHELLSRALSSLDSVR